VGKNGKMWGKMEETYAPHTQLPALNIFAKVVFIKNYKRTSGIFILPLEFLVAFSTSLKWEIYAS